MRRIAITLGYVGTAYDGWQRQPGRDTVQERVEKAVESLTLERSSVTASGRTDAGVHAIGQVAHFDTSTAIPAKNFVRGLNRFLPRDIRVTSAVETDEGFHARYDAHEKTYRYVIHLSGSESALRWDRAWRIDGELDVESMRRAAACLVGEHDFASFMSTGADTKTTVRRVTRVSVERNGDEVWLEFAANGFLYNMVRLMTAVLVDVGLGKRPPDDVEKILEARSKHAVTFVAPACGLYLVSVEYRSLSRK